MRWNLLDSAEREMVERIVEHATWDFPDSFCHAKRTHLVDVALDLLAWKMAQESEKGQKHKMLFQHRNRLILKSIQLSRRGQVASDQGFIPEPVAMPELNLESAPHHGHGAGSFNLTGAWNETEGFESRIGFRLALHNLLDPPRGFPDLSQIEFLKPSSPFGPIRVKSSFKRFLC